MRRYRNIIRKEDSSHNGWQVQVKRAGKIYVAYFGDGRIKSTQDKNVSLKKAIEWRNQIEKSLPVTQLKTKSPRNKSGVIGVCLIARKLKSGIIREYYHATWHESPYEKCFERFAVHEYGREKAFELAVKRRKAAVKKIVQKCFIHNPYKLKTLGHD